MADPLFEYRIHWAKTGDHKDEPPKVIAAHDYALTDGFYDFFVYGAAGASPRSLSVRASDVAMVERGDEQRGSQSGGPRMGPG
jgi:hypothetical protein